MKKNLVFLLAALFFAALARGQSITVIAPNGGESWPRGEVRDIAWTAPGCSGNVRINLIPAGGGAAQTVAVVPVADGRYPWAVGETNSGTAAAGDYRIGLYVPTQDVDDQSNAPFTVTDGTPPPALRVTSPNGGEHWGIGSTRAITWDPGGLSGDAQIILYKDNGARFDRIATVPVSGGRTGEGKYFWVVGETEVLKRTNSGYAPAGSYRIEIKANAASDRSDGAFAIQESDLPDLRIGDWSYQAKIGPVWTKTSEPKLGDQVRFFVTVRNDGQAPTGRSCRCQLAVEGPEGFTPKTRDFDVPPLPVGGTHGISIEYKCAQEGTVKIRVKLDAGDDVIEADETDNEQAYRHVVLPLPDLVACIEWDWGKKVYKSRRTHAYVVNRGEARSAPCRLRWFVRENNVVFRDIPALAPGEEATFSRDVKFYQDGTKDMEVIADCDRVVAESDERNNTIKKNAHIYERGAEYMYDAPKKSCADE